MAQSDFAEKINTDGLQDELLQIESTDVMTVTGTETAFCIIS